MLVKGDVCCYSFGDKNKSVATVEIVDIKTDERFGTTYAVIKFLEVSVDDTGNDFFTYLLNTGKTMNASFKYLKKIDKN